MFEEENKRKGKRRKATTFVDILFGCLSDGPSRLPEFESLALLNNDHEDNSFFMAQAHKN